MKYFINSCRFINHDINLKINDSCLVINKSNDFSDVIKNSPNPLTRIFAPNKENYEYSLNKVIEILAGHHFSPSLRNSFQKLINYHQAALSANSSENQLLNLWAALEGFLPSNSRKISRIKFIIDILLPVLTVTYPIKIFNYIADSVINNNSDLVEYINSKVLSGSFIERLVIILACEEYETERIDLCNFLESNPLLRNRLFWCFQNFSSSKSVKKLIHNHREKVHWHINRIYSTRNQIIHNAESLPYLEILIENLHSYIDTLVFHIIQIGINAKHPININSIIELNLAQENRYLKNLSTINETCNKENFKSIIFGPRPPYNYFESFFA